MPDKVKSLYKKDVRLKVSAETNAQIDALVAKLARHGIAIIRSGEMEPLFESVEGLEHSRTDGWLSKAIEHVAKAQPADLKKNESIRYILKAILDTEPKPESI